MNEAFLPIVFCLDVSLSMKGHINELKKGLQQFIDDVIAKFTALKDKVMSIVQSIKDAWNSTKNAV